MFWLLSEARWLPAGVDTCPECANMIQLARAKISAPEGGEEKKKKTQNLADHIILELGQIWKNTSHSTLKQARECTS